MTTGIYFTNFNLGNGIEDARLIFDNMTTDYFLKMDETRARDIVNSYKKLDLPRRMYILYDYDITEKGVESTILNERGMPRKSKTFVQHAVIRAMDIYPDEDFSVIIASQVLNK